MSSDTFLNIHSVMSKGVPDFEPVLSSELFLPLMIDFTPENESILSAYIPVAREWVEHEITS